MKLSNSPLIVATIICVLKCDSAGGFAPQRLPSNTHTIPLPTISDSKNRKSAGNNLKNCPASVYRGRRSKLHSVASLVAGVKSLHSNTSYVLSLVLWLSSFGISLERRTVIGKALSAPLATMALALTTANIGLLPFHSPVCK